jgi:hypothetical protein
LKTTCQLQDGEFERVTNLGDLAGVLVLDKWPANGDGRQENCRAHFRPNRQQSKAAQGFGANRGTATVGVRINYCAMENGFKRDLRNYPLYFLLWTVLGLFYFSQGLTQRLVSPDPTPWWHYLLAWLSGVYLWALLTPAILWLGRQFPVERRRWLLRITLHFLLSAGFSAFELSLESALYSRLHFFRKEHPLRALFIGQGPSDDRPQPTVNMLLRHGVKSCLEYVRTGDIKQARALSNPGLSPHVSFVDMGGHGYSVVRVTNDSFETEFVCIPRPLERSERPDGGPLNYRARFRTNLWKKGQAPKLSMEIAEGDPRFSI